MSASAVGDINGDGLADMMFGSLSTVDGINLGSVVIAYGKKDTNAINAADLIADQGGFALVAEYNGFGNHPTQSAGDVNGDGIADILVGSPDHHLPNNVNSAGRSYVVFGKANNTNLNLADVAAGTGGGFAIDGGRSYDYTGYSTSSAGDVNGDGLADLLIGTFANSTSALPTGRAYVVFGKADTTRVNLADVEAGRGGFVISSPTIIDVFGYSVSTAGDVNGDGLADVVMGTRDHRGATGSPGQAHAYVVFGKQDTNAVNVASMTNGFVINGEGAADYISINVSSAGDMNGDGLGDLIVAQNSYAAGVTLLERAYVVYGKTDANAVNLSAVANGQGGFAIEAATVGDGTGFGFPGVLSAGDINGDGFADLIVGANTAVTNGNVNSGRVYVIFGGQQFASTVDHLGGAGNDVLTGSSASETFVGGDGHDRIVGHGGSDVMFGGRGDDTFVLTQGNITALATNYSAAIGQLARVSGGTGINTLQLSEGANLDLTLISNVAASNGSGSSRISDIQRIDLGTDTAANSLTLGLKDLFDMAGLNVFNNTNVTGGSYNFGAVQSRHQLMVDGTSADSVVTTSGFVDTHQTAIMNGHTYEVYNLGLSAQLLIDININRSAVL